jgi:hypothetical protein
MRAGCAKSVGDAMKAINTHRSPPPITRGDSAAKLVIVSGCLEMTLTSNAPEITNANWLSTVASLRTISQSILPKAFLAPARTL